MTERILIYISILSLIIKYMAFSFSGILLVISLESLALFYLYFGFTLFQQIRFKELITFKARNQFSTSEIIGYSISGVVMAIALTGVLFKIQHWQGGKFIVLLGALGCFNLAIFSFVKKENEQNPLFLTMMIRGLALGLICLLLLFIPV